MKMNRMDGIAPELLEQFHAACERWRALSEFIARLDGVGDAELQREVQWLRWRQERTAQEGSPEYLAWVVERIVQAELWIHSHLRARMFLVETAPPAPGTQATAAAPGTAAPLLCSGPFPNPAAPDRPSPCPPSTLSNVP